MVDLNATWAPTPKSVLAQRARLEREAEVRDAWREDEAERNMNGIPPITFAAFKKRYG